MTDVEKKPLRLPPLRPLPIHRRMIPMHSPTPTPSQRHHAARRGGGQQTVYKMLTNTAYMGQTTWGKHENITQTVRRRRPQDEWISFTIAPLIDAATFLAAQETLVHLKEQASRI